jgi:AcrR family transcriptional regulator
MSRHTVASVLTTREVLPTVNGPKSGDIVIEGSELERGIRQAMARESVPTLSDLARRSHVRRDTMYGWFRKSTVRVSAGSVETLVSVLGSKPGDPWYEEPIERTVDAETRELLEAAVERAMDRLADRLIDFLDQRLPRNGHPAGT